MGNRAVITTCRSPFVAESDDLGVYVHWNGGRDSVTAFLTYCKMQGYRAPEIDNYGWARLCQVIGNFFGGSMSVGIDKCRNLDCENFDNGVYVIKEWKIVDRECFVGDEQDNYDLVEMLVAIDEKMPPHTQIGEAVIRQEAPKILKWVSKHE